MLLEVKRCGLVMSSHKRDSDWFTAMMADNINITNEVENVVFPEPAPEWHEARTRWKWAWPLHIYGLGSCYFILVIYATMSLIELRDRLRIQRYILVVNVFLFTFGICRSVYLFADAYEMCNILPTFISRVLFGIAFPCLTSAFSVMQLAFMRITKVKVGTNRLQNYKCLGLLIFLHFTSVILIDVLVANQPELKLLLLLCQTVFIIWCLVLCMGFVYSGFKMTQFTYETQKVLKQLTAYQKVKHESEKDGSKRIVMQRISKPKIRIMDEENRLYSCTSDISISSSDSLSCVDSHYDLEGNHIIQNTCNFENMYARSLKKRKGTSQFFSRDFRRHDYESEFTSESDYGTETPSTAGPHMEETEKVDSDSVDMEMLVPKQKRSAIRTLSIQRTKLINNHMEFSNPCLVASPDREDTGVALSETSETITHCSSVERGRTVFHTDASKFEQIDLQEDIGPAETKIEIELEIPQENGYMADTELSSPKPKRSKSKSKRSQIEAKDNEVECDKASPTHVKYELKPVDGTVSLYRIRQGHALHKVLKQTYFTTLLGFILCVLQLYAMFGVYGVLSTEPNPEPWPWYIFQTIFRIIELGMAGSMAFVTFNIGKQRQKTAAARKRSKRESRISTPM